MRSRLFVFETWKSALVVPPVVAIGAHAAGEAHAVGAGDRLHVDHVGAERREHGRRRRPRPPRGEVEHLHAVQRERALRGSRRPWAGGARSSRCARRGAAPGSAGARPRRRSATTGVGTRNVPVGSSTMEPRALPCSNSTTAGPSHTGATGMRSSAASATTSAVVCFVVNSWMMPFHSSQLTTRCGDRRPGPVLDEVGPLDHEQEAVELRAGVGVEADVAVGGRLDRRRLEAAAGRAGVGPAAQRVHEVGGGGAGGVRHLGDRDVDELARAASAHDAVRGQRGDRGVEPAHPLHGAPAHLHRCAVGASRAPRARRSRPAA